MNNKDAIDILLRSNEYHHARGDLPHSAASIEAFNRAISALKAERPRGEWKEYKLRNDIIVEYAFKCSNCKKDSGLLYRTDFCPNCGADMRGDKK